MGIMYRTATIDDLDTLVELGAEMAAESPRFSQLKFNAEKLRRTLYNLIDIPTGFVCVCDDDGTVVGGIAAICAPHWASDDLVASDLALFVRRDMRRSGRIALRLIERYVSWATDRGAVLIQMGITTGVHPEATEALYEHAGLRWAGTLMEA